MKNKVNLSKPTERGGKKNPLPLQLFPWWIFWSEHLPFYFASFDPLSSNAFSSVFAMFSCPKLYCFFCFFFLPLCVCRVPAAGGLQVSSTDAWSPHWVAVVAPPSRPCRQSCYDVSLYRHLCIVSILVPSRLRCAELSADRNAGLTS